MVTAVDLNGEEDNGEDKEEDLFKTSEQTLPIMVQDHHNKDMIKIGMLHNMATKCQDTEAAGTEVEEETGTEETRDQIGTKANPEVFLEEIGIKAANQE